MTGRYAREVALGGLLHDIGKFYQKAGEYKISNFQAKVPGKIEGTNHHAMISSRFVEHFRAMFNRYGLDTDAIKEMCQRHHDGQYATEDTEVNNGIERYRHLCNCVAIADNISSSERVGEQSKEGKNYETTSLVNPFTRADFDGSVAYIPAGNLENASTWIGKATNSHAVAYNTVLRFHEEVVELSKQTELGFNEWFSRLYNIIRGYTSTIPSAYNVKCPDISLFDHLSTTAAISSAMYSGLTSDSTWKKRMRTELEAAGHEYRVGAPKQFNNFTMLNIKLCGTEDYLRKNAIGSEAIKVANSYYSNLLNKFDSAVKEVLFKLGYISEINTVISTGTSKIVIINTYEKEDTIKALKIASKGIAESSELSCYIEVTSRDITQSQFNWGVLADILTEITSGIKQVDLGLGSLLTDDSGWLAPNSFSITRNSKDTAAVNKVNLRTNTFAVLAIKLHGVDETLNKMFNCDTSVDDEVYKDQTKKLTIEQLINDESYDINEYVGTGELDNYGSISRIASSYRIIGSTLKCRSEHIILSKTTSRIIVLVPFKKVFSIASDMLRQINDATCNKIPVSICIKTLKNANLTGAVLKEVTSSSYGMSAGNLVFNNNTYGLESLPKISEMMSKLDVSNVDSSEIYKVIDSIEMYRRYLETGDAKQLICIPRLLHRFDTAMKDSRINWNNQLTAYMKEQYTRVINGQSTDKEFISAYDIIDGLNSIKIRT